MDKIKEAFFEIRKYDGKLDILYNNASIYLGNQDNIIFELPSGTWKRIIGINLLGLYHCCKHAIPLIFVNGGESIVNTASSVCVIGIP
jgi:NAD(P)-dependent dehydrogenase (short-subunit alcohol dehydrogenase family)